MENPKKIILMVDQSLLVMGRMIPMLEALPNIQLVVHAGNSRDAMCMLRDIHPDVLLLDIDMPGHLGIELLRTVRNNYEHVVVFILTNLVSDQHRTICEQLGARFFDKSNEYDLVTEAVAIA